MKILAIDYNSKKEMEGLMRRKQEDKAWTIDRWRCASRKTKVSWLVGPSAAVVVQLEPSL